MKKPSKLREVRNSVFPLVHPVINKPVKLAFTIDDDMGRSQKFYEFCNLMDMPPIRWEQMNHFIREAEMRITGEELTELATIAKDSLNSDKPKVADCVSILDAIINMTNLYLETDTFYRVFSTLFITLDEPIEEYDIDYNDSKIEFFKGVPEVSFFLSKPITTYLPQVNLSPKDLRIFLGATKQGKKLIQEIKNAYTKKETAK